MRAKIINNIEQFNAFNRSQRVGNPFSTMHNLFISFIHIHLFHLFLQKYHPPPHPDSRTQFYVLPTRTLTYIFIVYFFLFEQLICVLYAYMYICIRVYVIKKCKRNRIGNLIRTGTHAYRHIGSTITLPVSSSSSFYFIYLFY